MSDFIASLGHYVQDLKRWENSLENMDPSISQQLFEVSEETRCKADKALNDQIAKMIEERMK